jgi:hypothetical protein
MLPPALNVGTAFRVPFLQKMQIALDDGHEIIEIVGNTTGELAYRFHLLALSQCFFSFFALFHFTLQQAVRIHKRHRPLLELEICFTQRTLGRAHHDDQ